MTNNEEQQYLDLIKNILDNGTWEDGRNGRVKTIFGSMMRYSLANNKIPILTTKKTAWKICLKELLWFIKGETDNKILQEQGVHIWDGNASREFLDKQKLYNYEEGELGPIYGFQWRNYNGDYKEKTGGIDQLQEIIDALRDEKTRTSRRLIMTAWNPCQIKEMALPPCHIMCQFNIHDGNKLTCAMYQRSVDVMLGQPFNIASYSFLTHLIAHHCGLEAYEFIHFMGNCHIYEDHMDSAKLQISREPYEFPKISINAIKNNINDYEVEDFEIIDYKSHDAIKMKMIA